jgi:hypothetical protein
MNNYAILRALDFKGAHMKRLTLSALAGLLIGVMSFPVAYASSGKLMPAYHGTHPNTHQVNVRLKKQWLLIMRAYKDGKITKSQAASLRADLKAVHKQEAAFFKVNKSYELTADQQSQLNKTLDTYSTTVGETTSNN